MSSMSHKSGCLGGVDLRSVTYPAGGKTQHSPSSPSLSELLPEGSRDSCFLLKPFITDKKFKGILRISAVLWKISSSKIALKPHKKCHCIKKKNYLNESASTLFKQKKSQKNTFFKVLNDKTCVFVEQVSMLVSCIS